MINPLQGTDAAQTLAQAIVNTIHEPLIVLDAQLRVMGASRSFYEIFQVDAPGPISVRIDQSLSILTSRFLNAMKHADPLGSAE